ncbi:AidB family quorum-quenching N-acyl homoserine lactonase [Oryzifoliimicrobium ureilyticus]|uniref:AidB family quorum-quenching N-acyl homoserine lactonase n=1 Tax=Oryzifoliimicrobium ureilyticus TaxID=3113724 RepID=UPI0030766BEC
MTRRFGPYEVTILVDGVFEAKTELLMHRKSAAALKPVLDALGSDSVVFDVNCFLLTGPDGLMLVDSGCGTAWGPNFGKARGLLAEMEIDPAKVKQVLLTHIHTDHALGLFEREDAFFPAAEILVPERDFAFFTDEAERERLPEARRGGFALARRLTQTYAGRFRLIGEGSVAEGIEAISLPGHTPGQMGFRIGTGGERLMIWADALHLADLQPADPDICLVFDLDTDTAAQTRRSLLASLAQNGDIAAGAHVSGFNRVELAGENFRLARV